MATRKNKNKDGIIIIKIKENLYINIDQIDCIELVDSHPSSGSKLNPKKYCIRYRNSYYHWSLVSIEDFEKNIKPYIHENTD